MNVPPPPGVTKKSPPPRRAAPTPPAEPEFRVGSSTRGVASLRDEVMREPGMAMASPVPDTAGTSNGVPSWSNGMPSSDATDSALTGRDVVATWRGLGAVRPDVAMNLDGTEVQRDVAMNRDGTEAQRDVAMNRDGTAVQRDLTMNRDGTEVQRDVGMNRDGTEVQRDVAMNRDGTAAQPSVAIGSQTPHVLAVPVLTTTRVPITQDRVQAVTMLTPPPGVVTIAQPVPLSAPPVIPQGSAQAQWARQTEQSATPHYSASVSLERGIPGGSSQVQWTRPMEQSTTMPTPHGSASISMERGIPSAMQRQPPAEDQATISIQQMSSMTIDTSTAPSMPLRRAPGIPGIVLPEPWMDTPAPTRPAPRAPSQAVRSTSEGLTPYATISTTATTPERSTSFEDIKNVTVSCSQTVKPMNSDTTIKTDMVATNNQDSNAYSIAVGKKLPPPPPPLRVSSSGGSSQGSITSPRPQESVIREAHWAFEGDASLGQFSLKVGDRIIVHDVVGLWSTVSFLDRLSPSQRGLVPSSYLVIPQTRKSKSWDRVPSRPRIFTYGKLSGFCRDLIAVRSHDGSFGPCTRPTVRFWGASSSSQHAGDRVFVFVDGKQRCELRLGVGGKVESLTDDLQWDLRILAPHALADEYVTTCHLRFEHVCGEDSSNPLRFAEATLFVYDKDDDLIISDVDGTVTLSDVGGHFNTTVLQKAGFSPKKYAHEGICSLFTFLRDNMGCHVLYLTARPLDLSVETRDYLRGLLQDDKPMPLGPCITDDTSYYGSLKREVVHKTSHLFKSDFLVNDLTRCFLLAGRDTRKRPLFSAAFGNKDTDAYAYGLAGVHPVLTFIIDSKSVLTAGAGFAGNLTSYEDPALFSWLTEMISLVRAGKLPHPAMNA